MNLVLIRHGESAGNVARDLALAQNLSVIDIAQRDCDVPLSALGERQSRALGEWLAVNAPAPDAVLTSPYVRSQQTARLLCAAANISVPLQLDERLREREFGMLDRLTKSGIEAQFPDQVVQRERLGKFYYRPPGGESWTDVVLRIRSLAADLRAHPENRTIFIITHQVAVLCFRYVLEELTEQQILAIDRAADVANCSVTEYIDGRLTRYNEVAPVQQAGEPVTSEPDVPVAPK